MLVTGNNSALSFRLNYQSNLGKRFPLALGVCFFGFWIPVSRALVFSHDFTSVFDRYVSILPFALFFRHQIDFYGSPPRGLSFWLIVPPTQSCFQVLVCLRATVIPVMSTPSGACAAVGPSHVFLLWWVRGARVGAASG